MSACIVAVSGTGTNVGKTHVASALTALLAESAPSCGYKPFESGHEGLRGSDQVALAAASSNPPESLGLRTRCFPLPVAPPVAARAAGAHVDFDAFSSALSGVRVEYTGTIVLELAGGLFSPFDDARSNADVLSALAPEVHLLVVPNRLGVIHDARATCLAARSVGLRFDALIVSHPPGSGEDPSCASNLDFLRALARVPVVVVPRGDAASAKDALRGSPLLDALPRR